MSDKINLSKEEIILNKIQQMFEISKQISDMDNVIGSIFLMNLTNSMDIISSNINSKELDVTDKAKSISMFLGIDFEQLVIDIVKKHNEKEKNINEKVDEEVFDFIINNSKNIDDYETFINKNKVKDELNYLKGNLWGH
jgi:hypothetical protein